MSERLVRHVFMHLLNGLREVHTHKLLHLDIKPANIYLRTDGTPVLLDFGAARQTLDQRAAETRADVHARIRRAGAVPRSRPPRARGPTVYGVGASMFACLAAFAPQAADARSQEDHLVSAKKIWAGQYSDNVLEVIDWCLRLDPLERPQSVFALQKAIRDIPPDEAQAHLPRQPQEDAVLRVRARRRSAGRHALHDLPGVPQGFAQGQPGPHRVHVLAATRCCWSSPTAWAGTRAARSPRRSPCACSSSASSRRPSRSSRTRSSSCRTRCCARTRRSAPTPTSSRCSRRRARPVSAASSRPATPTGRTSATRASTCSGRAG